MLFEFFVEKKCKKYGDYVKSYFVLKKIKVVLVIIYFEVYFIFIFMVFIWLLIVMLLNCW